MKKDITTDLIKSIMRQYYSNAISTLDNVDEIEKFLQNYKVLKLSQEEIGNLNRPTTI